MNALLQDAINETRAGNKKEAQLLLAQNLKENPDDAQSWYLLSMLVDSDEKQAIYLSKALALNPEHKKANERLSLIQYAAKQEEAAATAAANITISGENADFLNQAEGDTLPGWLADDPDSLQLEKVGQIAPEEPLVEVTDDPTTSEEKQVPQWLQENVSESWVVPEPPTQISTASSEKAPESTSTAPTETAVDTVAEKTPKPKKPKKVRTKKEEKSRLNLMLAGLIFAMIVVFLILIFIAL